MNIHYLGLRLLPVMLCLTMLAEGAMQALSAKLDCASGLRTFDPKTMKRKYKVGVYANEESEIVESVSAVPNGTRTRFKAD